MINFFDSRCEIERIMNSVMWTVPVCCFYRRELIANCFVDGVGIVYIHIPVSYVYRYICMV
jgi:hypothetical protein